MNKKALINKIGLIGILSFLSYTAAVIFAPLAYPGYNWMSQAVSDLSAVNSPSAMLWKQIAAVYNTCSIVCITAVCIFIEGKLTKTLRTGIYLFAAMNWISNIGYTMFPLSDSGNAGTFQDIMHIYVITALVVLLSVASLITITVGGLRAGGIYRPLGICAAIAFLMMMCGPIGMAALPHDYFGIAERFSTFSAVGFTAVLGIYLYRGFSEDGRKTISAAA